MRVAGPLRAGWRLQRGTGPSIHCERRRPETEITDTVAAPDMSKDADRGIILGKIGMYWEVCRLRNVRLSRLSFFEGLTHSEIAGARPEKP